MATPKYTLVRKFTARMLELANIRCRGIQCIFNHLKILESFKATRHKFKQNKKRIPLYLK